MILRRSHRSANGRGRGEADVLLQLQFGEELARRYEQEHIAIELRAADLEAREARAAELRARIGELEQALAQSIAWEWEQSTGNGHGPAPKPAVVPAAANPAAPRPKHRRLGRQLVKRRIVTRKAVREALQTQARTGEPIGTILVKQGSLTAGTLLVELARQHGVATVTPDDHGIALVPADAALRHSAVALAVGPRPVAPGALTAVGLVDLVHAAAISSVLGRPIEPRLADVETFARLFREAYGTQPPKIEPGHRPAAALAPVNGNGGHGSANGHGSAAVEATPGAHRHGASANGTRATSAPVATTMPKTVVGRPVLPTATILVALHRATPVTVGPLADALERLDYPRHRLQAIAVHDPSDAVTAHALRAVALPAWVAPLAPAPGDGFGSQALLRCGLREASGELITVVQSARQLSSGGLRAVAVAQDTDRLLRIDPPDGLTSTELADAYLRQVDEMQPAAAGGERGAQALPLVVFRTAELLSAIG
jgi:hypothetical protein